MQLNEEEFSEKFTQTLDHLIEDMAETPEIEPAKFFSMVCALENLLFFAPVIFGALRIKKSSEE